MILSIYRSRLFRRLVYFFIGVILSGCTSQLLIRDYGDPDITASSITKVYLDDGATIDFTNKDNNNQFINIDKDNLSYKNSTGTPFTVSTREITHLYVEHFDAINTIFLVLGSLALAFIAFIVALAISLHGHGFGG